MICITNGKIIVQNDILENKSVLIDNGTIIDIIDYIPIEAELIDANLNYISPGFIDIHIHGIGGYDTMDGSYNSINEMSKILAKYGITSFIPTTMTEKPHKIKEAVLAVKAAKIKGTEGANVLGTHLEGPFISKSSCGAQAIENIMEPDINVLSYIVDNDYSTIKSITLAPELNNCEDLIRFVVGHGINASIGHTDGDYSAIMNGISHGMSHSTHIYNSMTGFNHRAPGAVGAILDSRITTEMIADGIHCNYAALRIAIKAKGYDSCALISDSIMAATMDDGTYTLGGQYVFVKNGEARMENGKLGGSTLTLNKAVKNITKNTNLNICEAVYMATKVPARIAKVDSHKGIIKKGYDADLIIFDNDVNIMKCIINGNIIKA